MGLRWKSGLWLSALFGMVLLFALLVGRTGLESFRDQYGAGFARNHALLQAQKLVTVITRELSLSQRLAEIDSVRRFLRSAEEPQTAFSDLERFRRAFADESVFLISHATGEYWFGDAAQVLDPRQPSYTLDPDDPKDAWYYSTTTDERPFSLNVNVDSALGVTKLWFNVPVREDGRLLGLAGTGLDLTRFLDEFVDSADPGITNLIVNRAGAIVAHPDPALIEYAAITKSDPQHTLHGLLDRPGDRERLRQALAKLRQAPAAGATLAVDLQGAPRILGIAYIPELDWYAATAVDLGAAHVLDENRIWGVALAGAALLLLFATAVTVGVDRFILRPLQQLTDSARRIAAGDYSLELASTRRDELGALTRVFDGMAREVRAHTEELEQRVAARTQDLAQARDRIAAAHRQIQDSIRYASRIQEAMLPQRELERRLPGQHVLLWRPRDVVGGDCYVFRADEKGFLIGVIDCAGHGVPGAIMTMVAHAAFDIAVQEQDARDPASLLARMDAAARALLPALELDQQVATNMDVGLCHIDTTAGRIAFAGARMALYRSDGTHCETFPGNRRSLGDRRRGRYENTFLAAEPEATYYLATDGFLDQAGGDRGYGFGNKRFTELLVRIAALPMSGQAEALQRALDDYQGEQAQRDDITVLGFRMPGPNNQTNNVSGE